MGNIAFLTSIIVPLLLLVDAYMSEVEDCEEEEKRKRTQWTDNKKNRPSQNPKKSGQVSSSWPFPINPLFLNTFIASLPLQMPK